MIPIFKTAKSLLLAQCALLALFIAAPVTSAQPKEHYAHMEHSVLFETGRGNKYKSIRIPCVLALPDNTVLAVASGRSKVSDWADIDMIMRRSTNGGKNWEPMRVLADHGNGVADNPVLIWDGQTQTTHFLYQVNYERVLHMTSTDSGKTWTKPADITPQLGDFKKCVDWNVIAPGPGHGIQLKNGRLLAPTWLAHGKVRADGTRAHGPSVITSIYSDDHGKTWHCGELLPRISKHMNETTAVTTDDDRVMFITRTHNSYKTIALSPDGATQWTKPEINEDLFTPNCFGSSLRISGSPDKSRILFCNPDSRHNMRPNKSGQWRARTNLTVKLSYDDGKTWPVSKVIDPGRSSYSDLAMLPDGTILCLYEHGDKYISIARFSLEWLTDCKDTLGKADAAR
ncbi:sialidase family protein [Ereboglobus luteus]|nr:sialidase family protein [Ereboglobus luteus]